MCSQIVWQAVQLKRSRFLASAMAVMVTTASFPAIARSPQLQSKQIAAKVHVAVDVDIVEGRPLTDQLRAGGPQELAGPIVGQAGKPVFEGEFSALLGLRCMCFGLHDGVLADSPCP